jgi:formimidoylglutamate deiminase
LCPTTEANLGDGLFALKPYLDAGGAIGIGSDSHVSVSPVEELRWLEYGQRLATRRRNIGASRESASVGETLFRRALDGGARASGARVAALADTRADWVALDAASPILAGRDTAHVIDTWLFAGNSSLVQDVVVGGTRVVQDFRHRDEERIAARYRDVVEGLARSV